MRHFILIVLAVANLSPANGQTIRNSSFETSGNTSTTFESWEIPSGKQTISKDEDPANGRKYVLKFQNPDAKSANAFTQRINFTPGGFSKYHYSGWVKTANVNSGYAGIWFRAFDKDGIKLTYTVVENYALKGTNDWTKVGFDVFVPSLTAYLELGGLLAGDVTAWFDEIQLEQLPTGKIGQSKTAKKYLDNAIKIIRANSMRKDAVDFKALTDIAYSISANAKKPADCYTAIRTVLSGLGDHHSFFRTPEESKAITNEATIKIEMPTAKMIGNYGYVTIPAFSGINEMAERKFADSLQSLIKSLDANKPKGWIVDVRDNTGGNCWPMISGIGPILGDGISSYTVFNNGKKTASGYRNGVSFSDAETVMKMENPYLLAEQNPYVAVLTNNRVASSGEGIVLSFKNRPKAKSFGQATYGLTTSNADFTLSDGAMLFVTCGIGGDRAGNLYGKEIQPDEWIDDNDATEADEVLDAAIKWLKETSK